MLEHQKEFETLFPDNELFYIIDSTSLSEHEVAMKIAEMAQKT